MAQKRTQIGLDESGNPVYASGDTSSDTTDLTVGDDLSVTDDETIGGDLTVTGATVLNGTLDLNGVTTATAKITTNAVIVTTLHAAPSDGSLAAGECAIWFDQTNGAGKLMVKAKTANGTVASGSVSLS